MANTVLWRNLGLPVRFGPLDGRAAVLMLLALYHWSKVTMGVALAGMIVLYVIEKQLGYSIPNMVRRVTVVLVGRHRPFQTARRIRSDR